MGKPRVAVGNKFMKGAERWPSSLAQFELVPFDEAFDREWDFDAHFVTYDVPGLEAFPRLKKSSRVVDDLRDQGYEVLQTIYALDYDNPEHAAWLPEALSDFKQRVELASLQDPLIDAWARFYTTKHGARFVYVLKEPIPVGPESEAMHRSLVRAWGQRGIALDPACSDWTRYFRLPKVMRD